MKRKVVLLAGACGVAAIWPVAGMAQTAQASAQVTPGDTQAAPATQAATTQAAPAAADNAALGDIIVTATRREQRLQDVPLAVTAVDGDTLVAQKINDITNIHLVTPSVSYTQANNASSSGNIVIRGIGTVGVNRSFEGAVGVFLDGVYRTRSGQALQNFLDIDDLQVLRGPQGTLFGKNTSAGAILINSAKPSLDKIGGAYEVTIGNYDTHLFRAALNVPLSDTLGIRVAGLSSDQDGFVRRPGSETSYNGRHVKAVKAQLLWEPASNLQVRLIGDYSHERENCCYGTVDDINGPTQPLIDALTLANNQPVPSKRFDDYQATLDAPSNQMIKDYGGTLQINWTVPGGEIRSITALRRWRFAQTGSDADFSGADLLTLDEAFASDFLSQELTYSGKIAENSLFKSANYVIGAYYSDEKIGVDRSLYWGRQAQTFWDTLFAARGLPPGTFYAGAGRWSTERFDAGGKSYAGFGQITVDFRGGLSLIGGLRYSRETKYGIFTQVYYDPRPNDVYRAIGVYPGPQFNTGTANNALTGTAGLQYHFSPSAQAYFTFSHGFKSGGINLDAGGAGTVANNPAITPGGVPIDPTFKPEYVNGFELGFKADYLDHRARTNISLFYTDLKNLQVAQFLGLQFRVLNAPSARAYGAEIENTVKLSKIISIDVAATFIPVSDFGTSPLLGAPLSGRRFSYSPQFAANAGVRFDTDISSDFAVEARVAGQYQSSTFTNTSSNAIQGAYGLMNASLGLRAIGYGATISLFCQNCTDTRYRTQNFNTPLQTGDQNAYVGAPRTFGATLRGKF